MPKVISDEKRLDKNRKKLVRALTSAGLSWASYSSIVEISDFINNEPFPDFGAAVWIFNTITKREQIIIPNRTIENFNAKELVFIIKHEMLHKAMFRNIRGATNEELINFALDACVQKILYLGDRTGMIKLCAKMFDQDRVSVTAICNPSLTRDEYIKLPSGIRAIFDCLYKMPDDDKIASEIIGKHGRENIDVPDPTTLYMKLSNLLTKEQKEEISNMSPQRGNSNGDGEKSENKSKNNNKKEEKDEAEDNTEDNNSNKEEEKEQEEGQESGSNDDNEEEDEGVSPSEDPDNGLEQLPHGGESNRRSFDKTDSKLEKELAEMINDQLGGGYCSIMGKAVGKLLNKYVLHPAACNTEDVQAFVDSWHTLRQVEGAEQYVYSEIQSHVRFDPYPLNLTRTGLEFIALGVSGPDSCPLYLNDSDTKTCKKKVRAYIDTSPSMNYALPYVMHVIDFFDNLEECEYANDEFEGRYFFSEKVMGAGVDDWEKFKQGTLRSGYGTSFEAVINHAMETFEATESDIILIITDGESSLSDEAIEAFNQTGMKCYAIYFIQDGYQGYSYWSRKCKKEGARSDLDSLEGATFEIIYKPQNNRGY